MKQKFRKWLSILAAMFSLFDLRAQSPVDTVILSSVEITGHRSQVFQTGARFTYIDSAAMAADPTADLGEVLSRNSTVFVKDYGPGSLSSVSFRGTSAEHTRVMWEGVPLNSPALGLADLSILPAFLFGKAEVMHGGASALAGVSALGGQVRLSGGNQHLNGWKSRINLSGGSFGEMQGGGSFSAGNGKIFSRTAGFFRKAANNFSFPNSAELGSPIQRQTHAAFRQYAILQSVSIAIAKRHQLNAGVWFQSIRREIPPSMTVPVSHAVERDSALRAFLGWKSHWSGGHLNVSTSWSNEYIGYFDSTKLINSELAVRSSYSEVEFRHLVGQRVLLHGGAIFNGAFATSNNFGGKVSDLRGAIFAGAKMDFLPGWKGCLTLRKDITQHQDPPLTPLIGLEGKLIPKKLTLKASWGRTFNLPTLNQKYWIPGGNPDLLPEKGWTSDLGFAWAYDYGFSGEFTGYYSKINNWLLWAPDQTTGLWSPHNVKQVEAAGFEASINWSKKWAKSLLKITGRYLLSSARNTQTHFPGLGNSLQKQLIYTPLHSGNLNLQYHLKQVWINYGQSLVGSRFTTSDNGRSLPVYTLGRLAAGINIKSKVGELSCSVRSENIFNSAYQAVEWRAMPGRSFLLALDWQFSQIRNTKK